MKKKENQKIWKEQSLVDININLFSDKYIEVSTFVINFRTVFSDVMNEIDLL